MPASVGLELQLDRIVRGMYQVLLGPEIALGRLHGSMPEKQLDLLQFPACRTTELRGCPAQVVWRNVRDTGFRRIAFQHLPNSFLAQPASEIRSPRLIGPEQVSVTHLSGIGPRINSSFDPGRHGDGPYPPVLADQIHNAPAIIPLLNVLERERR